MYVCMYIYMYVYIYVCMYVDVCMYMYIYIYTYTYIYIHTYICLCVCARVCVYTAHTGVGQQRHRHGASTQKDEPPIYVLHVCLVPMPYTYASRVHRCGAAEALVRSINTHANQATLQEQGSLAIWSIATESIQAQPDPTPPTPRQNPAAAAQGKGGAAAKPAPSPKAKAAVRELPTAAEERREALTRAGALDSLLLALHQHKANHTLCERVARALVVLSYNHKPRSRSIYNGPSAGAGMARPLGGLQILSGAMQVHVKHAHVCCQVAVLVRMRSPSPTLSPTDPVPRGLLTLCPGASCECVCIYIYIYLYIYMYVVIYIYYIYISKPTCGSTHIRSCQRVLACTLVCKGVSE